MLHVSIWVSPSQAGLKSLYLTWLFDVICQNRASMFNKHIKSDFDISHDAIPYSYSYISKQCVRIVYDTTQLTMAMPYWKYQPFHFLKSQPRSIFWIYPYMLHQFHLAISSPPCMETHSFSVPERYPNSRHAIACKSEGVNLQEG